MPLSAIAQLSLTFNSVEYVRSPLMFSAGLRSCDPAHLLKIPKLHAEPFPQLSQCTADTDLGPKTIDYSTAKQPRYRFQRDVLL